MLLTRTLLSHWRRHPVQALFLLTGIVIANVLLVGTLLINAQARASYASGEQLLEASPNGSIEPADGRDVFAERHYFVLRRAGFHQLAPVLRQFVVTADGVPVELLGIDLYAMPRSDANSRTDGAEPPDFAAFASPPFRTWGASARLDQLGWAAGGQPRLKDGGTLPPLEAVDDAGLGHRLVMDIGALQELTGSRGKLSRVLVFERDPARLDELRAALPDGLDFAADTSAVDAGQLTRSLHLNLAAMGLLAFVVGVFLTYNAIAFSLAERRELFRRLKLTGVTRGELARALVIELAVFTAAGVALGYALGSQLALTLLPGVGLSLAQLYDVYIAYPDRVVAGGWVLPLAMTAIAVAGSVFVPLREAIAAPPLRRQEVSWGEQAARRRDSRLLYIGLALLVLSLVLGIVALEALPRLWLGLLCMAALLLGAALCLPQVLRWLLAILDRGIDPRHARAAWLVADTRWLLGPAAVALMALTLALTANSGLNTMITSFREATDRWLEQRLAAEVYLGADIETAALAAWLQDNVPGAGVAERYATSRERTTPRGATVAVEISGMPLAGPFLAGIELMRGSPDALGDFAGGDGILISERAWRLEGWQVGDIVSVCRAEGDRRILGVYPDYGNPAPQWLVAEPLFRRCWPGLRADGRGLFAAPGSEIDWGEVQVQLKRDFGLSERDVIDQRGLRDIALGVFDRTFVVTQALNALTLLVAAIGIFCAVSAIHHHRLHHQALLAALGLTRRERTAMQALQWGLLGVLCVAIVWPFGTALAWVLSQVVTPVAFGWSFGLEPDWKHYPALAGLAAASLLLAVLVPAIRLLATPPAVLLREEPA